MKNKTLIALLVLLSVFGRAQNIDVKWSDKFEYNNKKDGFFEAFIGSNNTYIYGKFANLALKPSKYNKKIKLIAFDKNTMKKAGELELKGYGGAIDKEDYKYYRTVTLDNQVYIFWTVEQKSVIELYVQSFDVKLKKVNPLKKVYEVNRKTKNTAADKLFIIYNNDVQGKIVIAKEFGINNDNENLRVEYKLLAPDFSFITSRQVTLPILVTKRKRSMFTRVNEDLLVGTYEFGDDGNLYVKDMVKMSDEEKKNLKKRESSVYPHIMQVQMESGSIRDYSVKFPGKNTFNTSILVTKNGVKLYGFFSDLDKDEKGRDTHGTFFVNLDSKDFDQEESKFSYFTKSFLDELYSADKENQKKGSGIFKSKKAKESDDESLDDNYVIERVVQDGDDILLFCSIMRNWSRTVCSSSSNGAQSCHTYYYCTKSNVTAFRLNKKGDILWAKNLDRSITYNGWYKYDLSVVKSDDNYYVVYGSAYQLNAKKKNRRSKKSGKQMTDRLEYAVFSGKTGDFKKYEKQINTINAKKADKKYISPESIDIFDNKMYADFSRIKTKATVLFGCLCPPIFPFLYNSGNFKKGSGCFATITPLK